LDAEWITAKKDWLGAQRRTKQRESPATAPQEHTAEHPEPRDPISNGVASGHPPEHGSEAGTPSQNSETSRDSAAYQSEMDEMRCILYSHGGMNPPIQILLFGLTSNVPGGYYFGSVDQER
jgi:hypothetical protein